MTHQEINNIKQSAPQIEEVIGRYVQLTRKGKSLLGLCPFHEDHHPSLTVNPEKQYFTCFACGEKGDVIHFFTEDRKGVVWGSGEEIKNGKWKIEN
ncbi:MAG: CHC2 zinc finger domain-containing protein [Parabacteroides gordonii]|nr:CHC2 zinc finger domain-containing protein [Parabacteroides gordonii]